jgi:hypothetical protein
MDEMDQRMPLIGSDAGVPESRCRGIFIGISVAIMATIFVAVAVLSVILGVRGFYWWFDSERQLMPNEYIFIGFTHVVASAVGLTSAFLGLFYLCRRLSMAN